MGFNIVLVEPEIPTNTGNIGRLTLASGSTLHIVMPMGFELNNKRLKRAGLDYWKYISINIYKNIEDFYLKNKEANMVYFSSSATKNYTSINFQDNMFFLFGKESEGLSKEIVKRNIDKLYKIPIYTKHVRSLNLANAVSIVVYEGLRNLKKL